MTLWKKVDAPKDAYVATMTEYTQIITYRRYWPTWRERLFTRPWRPWRRAWIYDQDGVRV